MFINVKIIKCENVKINAIMLINVKIRKCGNVKINGIIF